MTVEATTRIEDVDRRAWGTLLDLRGEQVDTVQVIKAEFGRTSNAYVCIRTRSGKRIMVGANYPNSSFSSPRPPLEEMQKAVGFFTPDELDSDEPCPLCADIGWEVPGGCGRCGRVSPDEREDPPSEDEPDERCRRCKGNGGDPSSLLPPDLRKCPVCGTGTVSTDKEGAGDG